MGKAANKKKTLEGLEVSDVAAKGKAIARHDGMVVFIRDAVPGDVVDVRVTKRKKNYLEGFPVAFHKAAPDKQTPFCAHFWHCGGCTWQTLTYEKQLYYKEKEVRENLTKIGKVDLGTIHPIIPSERATYYRNKMEFTFSRQRWLIPEEIQSEETFANRAGLGFHKPGQFDKVIDIQHCYLQDGPSNELRNEARRIALEQGLSFYDPREKTGFLRNLVIRTTSTEEFMVNVVFHYDAPEARESFLKAYFDTIPSPTSLVYTINQRDNDDLEGLRPQLYAGRDHLVEELPPFVGNDPLRFKIAPLSFFQTNSYQAPVLYQKVAELAGLTGNEVVHDLYCGTGTISLYLAPLAKAVHGMEYVEDAVADAMENARMNGIGNVDFTAGDIKDLLRDEALSTPDVVVTDPPRAGMHKKVVKRLYEQAPPRIVYVSCNPATQARDIGMLSDLYQVSSVQPVDMFPQTYHVENIALLERVASSPSFLT